ncbi:MAG: enoyl-CoA hydratase-related protein [Actinomycetota bacterium]
MSVLPYPDPIDGLRVERDGAVLRLTLDRPERRNALTDEIVVGLADVLDAAGSDDDVRVIHLSGEGDHFCSGFDLSGRERPADDAKPRTGSTQRHMRWRVNRLVPTMLEVQTPIVCEVRGWAIGLGMNLALASDFAVAADEATFMAPFTTSGFTPDSGASWLLPRLVGVARAKDVLMLGDRVSGADAAAWGMIHRAVPAGEVAAVSEELVQRLAASATVAVGLAKMLVNRAGTVDLARHLEDEGLAIELSSRSADFAEASRARREKRHTDFTGR